MLRATSIVQSGLVYIMAVTTRSYAQAWHPQAELLRHDDYIRVRNRVPVSQCFFFSQLKDQHIAI